jgi:hypothetical protein
MYVEWLKKTQRTQDSRFPSWDLNYRPPRPDDDTMIMTMMVIMMKIIIIIIQFSYLFIYLGAYSTAQKLSGKWARAKRQTEQTHKQKTKQGNI